MTLRELVAALPGSRVLAMDAQLDAEVRGLVLDSRKVGPGDVFFALPGVKADGARFAEAAVAAGAIAVVGASALCVARAAVVEVDEPRLALAQAACAFHGEPSRVLEVVAVTGTNGKTTTTFMIESIFRAAARRAGVIGTTGVRLDGETRPTAFTTPEAPELQSLLAEMRERGVTSVALEASSHALAQRRTWGLACDVAVFTNVTQDHLDYHGTLEAYLDAKLMLFDGRNGGAGKAWTALVNVDDAAAAQVAASARAGGGSVVGFGESAGAEVRIASVTPGPQGLAVKLATPTGACSIALPMLGRFNAWNATGAFAAASALGIGFDVARRALETFAGVPGRLERVNAGQPFTVVVDYAHTPDALERALAACREHARGRVLCVFGCGGDRDRGKRPQMGALAARLADIAWVTNDNPRSEDPAAIAREIIAGAPFAGLVPMLDRRNAIGAAVGAAREGDIVLIAGKGHETTQTIGADVLPFDDREVARAALGALL